MNIPSYTEQQLNNISEQLHKKIEKITKGKEILHTLVDDTNIALRDLYNLWVKTKEYITTYPKRSLMAILALTLHGEGKYTTSDTIHDTTTHQIEHTTTQSHTQEKTYEYKTKSLEQSKKEFGDFIALHKDLHQYDKSSTFWRWIRIARYDKNIRKALEHAPHIAFELFQGLYMVEWEWNTWSINSRDGWAGLIHFQPDVAKKERNMKIFTDDPKYSQYDFDLLRSQGKSKQKIYALHGKILEEIRQENDGQARLSGLDDRFNPKICLEQAAIKLEKTYKSAKKLLDDDNPGPKESAFKDYVKNTIHGDIYQYAAINWFNKWQWSFYVISTEKSGNHMQNVKKNADDAKKYNKVLEQGILQWLSGEDLWNYIITTINPNQK